MAADTSNHTASSTKLRLIQAGRIAIALSVPLATIAYAYILHGINEFYARRSHDALGQSNLWLANAPEIIASIVAGLFIAFWRFRSEPAGKSVIVTGIVMLFFVGIFVWSVLSG